MNLPYSDELNIGYLSRLYDNTSNCYKFFWFQAILRKIDGSKDSFTFDELINEMIADAWYMVTEYHLRLGPVGITDNLEEVVKYIYEKYGLIPSEKRDKLLTFLQNTDDKEIKKYKSLLTLNVPYRLQVPFYDEINIENRMWNGPKQILTEEINRQKRLMYYFSYISGLESVIAVDDRWAEYLLKNKEILIGWTHLKLIHYLQIRNPSVPGISEKIESPASRDIDKVRKYWKLILQIDPSITDIYGGITLVDESISVDHFIPWQYVAHDELWNLHPTTKSINSSKSNSLPAWDNYFAALGDLEFKAYELKETNELIAHEFDRVAPYHLNNPDIRNRLYTSGLSKGEFVNRLEHVMKPVYESAQTSGFKEWIYYGG